MSLSSARIAERIALGRIPAGKELFLLAAAVVGGARDNDACALELGLDTAAGLLEAIPTEHEWEACRGHLTATMEFAWLLLRKDPAGLAEMR